MSNSQAARDQQPPIDPKLQNKLITKFGKVLMKQGFTALPQLVQRYYRYVPGNPLYEYDYERDAETKTWCKKSETKRLVCDVSHMTPSEYALMTAVWSYWWSSDSDPWPSVEHLCQQLDKSDRQIRRYLQRLRDKGFMLSMEQYNGEGKQISNRYDFSPFLKRLVEYLDAIEQAQKQAQDASSKRVQNGRERVSSLAGKRVSNATAKTNRNTDSNSTNEDDSDSSGSAATLKGRGLGSTETYSHIEPSTIRNNTEGTEETNFFSNTETSNRPQTPDELGAAAHAKDVGSDNKEENCTEFKTRSELGAAAAGIPREHLEQLGKVTRKRPDVPYFIEACLDDISPLLNDAQSNSSITQAHNLYVFYKNQFEDFAEEQFRKHLYMALKRAKHLLDEETAIRRNGKPNKMPAFFGAFKASLRREYGVEPLKGSGRTHTSEGVSPGSEGNVEAPVSTATEATQESDHQEEQSHSHRVQKVVRTPEQKEDRQHYAEHVRNRLRHYGVAGSLDMIVDREHVCGCPLFLGDFKCVRCRPDPRWEQDVLVLIDTILEH